MKTLHFVRFFLLISIILICSSSVNYAEDWGFFGHRRINRMAVFTLPSEIIRFYKKNIEYLTEHAVDPDKRRYATKHEAVRHYIDIDHWGDEPFKSVPKNLPEAIVKFCDLVVYTENDTITVFGNELAHAGLRLLDAEKKLYRNMKGEEVHFTYTEYSTVQGNNIVVKENAPQLFGEEEMIIPLKDLRTFAAKQIMPMYYEDEIVIAGEEINEFFKKYGWKINAQKAVVVDNFSQYGICPYNLMSQLEKLTRAFEAKDEGRILRVSAEIGHYIGDAHVPLHTTENYNGQLTNQDGIHGFWESRLPEMYADKTYNYWVGMAEYVDNPRDYFWGIVEKSHSFVDTVLAIERKISKEFPLDKQYCYETRNTLTVRTQCKEYAAEFHKQLNGMVEQRLTATVFSVGSIWYTAWVNAGQPNLNEMGKYALTEEEKKKLEKEEALFRGGNIKGREHGE